MKWTDKEKHQIAQLVTMGLSDSKIAERMSKTHAAVKHYRQRHITDIKIEDSKEVTTEANGGSIQRQFGTPKPSDGYEIKNGYTMGQKTLKVLEYDTNGLLADYTIKGLQEE